jgi:hypothetical protein
MINKFLVLAIMILLVSCGEKTQSDSITTNGVATDAGTVYDDINFAYGIDNTSVK